MTDTAEIDKIDKALGKYYAAHNRDDYFDENGMGKFKIYCDVNGIENDDLDDELQAGNESILIDFDEDIPLNQDINESEQNQKVKEILNILSCCYNNQINKILFKSVTFDFNSLNAKHFEIDEEKDIETVQHIYMKQWKLYRQIKEKGLNVIFAIQYKLKLPYLLLLIDTFCRDRIAAKINKNQPSLYWGEWMRNNKHFKYLEKLRYDKINPSEIVENGLKGAIDGHCAILCPLQFQPLRKIMDSIYEISKYFVGMIGFIHNLITKNDAFFPFQWDAITVFNEAKPIENIADEDDDDEDDDDDDDYDDDDEFKKEAFQDYFGNIKQKLKSEKLTYYVQEIDENDEDKKIEAIFGELFDKFKYAKIIKKYGDEECKEYPKYSRFCTIIDRRKPDSMNGIYKNKEITKKDEIIFYEPTTDCNKIPKPYRIPEFMLNASAVSLLPNIGYNDKDMIEKEDIKQDVSTWNISSRNTCNMQYIMFSFHVESAQQIKCYLGILGQMTRFYPCDICDVLPFFFHESFGNNKDFLSKNNKEIKQMIDNINFILKDVEFDSFYAQYSNSKSN